MKISKRYIQLLKTGNKVDFVEGTTAAGKTTTIVPTKFLYEVKKSKKKKHIIAAESLGVISSNILNTGEYGLCDLYPGIEVYLSGSSRQRLPHIKIDDEIIFLVGYDNISRFKKVLGGQFGAVYIDEINIANQMFLNELFLPRFEYLIATLNPDDPDKPVYKELINRSRPHEKHIIPDYMWDYLKTAKPKEDWGYWFFTYDDNPSMTEDRKKDLLSSLMPGTIHYKTKIKGIRAKFVDLIFGDLPKEIIVSEAYLKKQSYTRFLTAIDTSYSKQTEDTNVFGYGAIMTDGTYARLDEIVVNNKDVGKVIYVNKKKFILPLAASDVCLLHNEFLKEMHNKWGFTKDVVIDGPATVMEYDKLRKKNGWLQFPANANKFKNKVKVVDRITFFNSWIATRKYIINETCKEHIKELESYSYNKNGMPEDKGDHTINEAWYEIVPYRDKIGI